MYYSIKGTFQSGFLVAVLVLLVVNTVQGDDDDDGGKHWALLVAGSNMYFNYRHQADICHAYHIVSNNGIPDERIIVMMYDDIAHNSENPFQGNIINEPNGTNVYPGVPKDYTGEDVKPEVFLKVLTGDSDGIQQLLGRPGKVIKSGPKDRIFVNFADHGAPGILGFPTDMLHAEDLIAAINKMHQNKQYKQMVFYVEACESGSVFNDTLKNNINVFATTAASPDESSFACYYDEERKVYLGDVYSVNWMQDSDQENLKKETLRRQFKIVKKETNTSHVQEYGDLKMGRLPVADFQGTESMNTLRFVPRNNAPHPTADAVPSEAASLEIMRRKLESSSGAERERNLRALQDLWERKKASEAFIEEVFSLVVEGASASYDYMLRLPVQFTDFGCYRKSVDRIHYKCPNLALPQNDFALRKLRVVANLCETGHAPEKIWEAIDKVASTARICG